MRDRTSVDTRAAPAWCGRRDLNPHDFRQRNLNPSRLPVPPRPPGPRPACRASARGRAYNTPSRGRITKMGIWGHPCHARAAGRDDLFTGCPHPLHARKPPRGERQPTDGTGGDRRNGGSREIGGFGAAAPPRGRATVSRAEGIASRKNVPGDLRRRIDDKRVAAPTERPGPRRDRRSARAALRRASGTPRPPLHRFAGSPLHRRAGEPVSWPGRCRRPSTCGWSRRSPRGDTAS